MSTTTVEAEVARQAADIEVQLGPDKLRKVALTRAQKWLDRSRETDDDHPQAETYRRKTAAWARVYVGRSPIRDERSR